MGLISTIQNKTEQARAKERIKPLLEDLLAGSSNFTPLQFVD